MLTVSPLQMSKAPSSYQKGCPEYNTKIAFGGEALVL